MTLLSYQLFGHCSVSADDELITDNINSSDDTSIEVIASAELCPIDEGIDSVVLGSLDSVNDSIQPLDDPFLYDETSVLSDDFTSCTHDEHSSSSCSGFILSDDGDSFISFDSDHGACDWDTSMSLNSDDF